MTVRRLKALRKNWRDEERSGRKATYTPEQICAIIAMACEQPDKDADGPPITHWSARELADEAARRGIVKTEFALARSGAI